MVGCPTGLDRGPDALQRVINRGVSPVDDAFRAVEGPTDDPRHVPFELARLDEVAGAVEGGDQLAAKVASRPGRNQQRHPRAGQTAEHRRSHDSSGVAAHDWAAFRFVSAAIATATPCDRAE